MQIHIEYTGFEQQMRVGAKHLIPLIYDGMGEASAGFNARRIVLDGSERSLLNWSAEVETAQRCIRDGLMILWDLDLHLQEGLLDDDSRFLTLQLAVSHFVDTVWPSFHESSLGVCLYRGVFTEQVIDYVKLLAALLPEEALCFVFLDTTPIHDLGEYFRLLSLEKFGHLKVALKGPFAERYPYALPALAWDHHASPLGVCASEPLAPLAQTRITYGICLPEKRDDALVAGAVRALGKTPFRVIPEPLLTQEWDGIEKLIVFPALMDERGWRKIRGFEAASGEVINYPDGGASLQLR